MVCRTSRPQRELERFYQAEGVWQHDPKRRAGGRGAWVCADNEACHKTKALRRTFRAQAETVSDLLQAHRVSKSEDAENTPYVKSFTGQNLNQHATPNKEG